MKTYTCNSFTGHYLGGCAVVRARDAVEAADKLNAELMEHGLKGDAKIVDMIQFPIGRQDDVRILFNGDY